jgi:hypothetical protein
MTYFGYVQNGVVVFEPPVSVADGTRVQIAVPAGAPDFWNGRSIEQLAIAQGIGTQPSGSGFAAEWTDDDNVDDFLALVREVRR